MKKLSNFIKRFPFVLDIAHSIGVIILTLDLFKFINHFKRSQFLDWVVAEQIIFRFFVSFIFGCVVSYIWEGEIQDKRLNMDPSKRDAINMIVSATLAGAFLPYLNFGFWTLFVATALLGVVVIAYIKMVLNNKKQ